MKLLGHLERDITKFAKYTKCSKLLENGSDAGLLSNFMYFAYFVNYVFWSGTFVPKVPQMTILSVCMLTSL